MADTALHPCVAAVRKPSAPSVLRIYQQRACAGPFTSASMLWHHELFDRRWRRPISTIDGGGPSSRARSRGRSSRISAGREIDLSVRRLENPRQAAALAHRGRFRAGSRGACRA